MNRTHHLMFPCQRVAKAQLVCRLLILTAACLLLTACGEKVREKSEANQPVQTTPGNETISIEQNWQEQNHAVHAHLDGYGWVNQAAGIVHIPIDRAMSLIVAGKISSGPATDPVGIPDYRESNSDLKNEGRRLFTQYGCSVCHDPDSPSHAPSLVGILGQRVRLSDGSFVPADEQYLRNSILYSKQQVVAGYVPVMPAYSSVISEPDVVKMIAYLKSTGPASTPIPGAVHSP